MNPGGMIFPHDVPEVLIQNSHLWTPLRRVMVVATPAAKVRLLMLATSCAATCSGDAFNWQHLDTRTGLDRLTGATGWALSEQRVDWDMDERRDMLSRKT